MLISFQFKQGSDYSNPCIVSRAFETLNATCHVKFPGSKVMPIIQFHLPTYITAPPLSVLISDNPTRSGLFQISVA